MSDDDDWEKQLEDEDELEKKLNAEKTKAFKDEDEVDSDEERKKKKEEQKKAEQNAPPAKKKQVKKDYDKMFEERLATSKGGAGKNVDDIQKSNLSREAKNNQLSMAAEQDITDSLFADMNV